MMTLAALLWTVGIVMTALLSIAVASVLLLTIYLRRPYSHIPSPKTTSFLFGHLKELEREKAKGTGNNTPDGLILKWVSEVGNVFVIFLLWTPIVVVLNPADIETVHKTKSHSKSKMITGPANSMFGERNVPKGIFTIADHDTWYPIRKLFDPAFSTSYLKGLVPQFDECVNEFLNDISTHADGKSAVPMKQLLQKLAMTTISKVAFSDDFTQHWDAKSLQLTDEHKYPLSSLPTHLMQGVAHGINGILFQYLHPYKAEMYRKVVRAFRMIGRDCIQQRMKALESGQKVPNDILTLILKQASVNDTVDLEDLVDNFVTFYVAGQETTASVMCFAVIAIHQNPTVLDTLMTEIHEVLGERTAVTSNDLDRLVYTEQIIKEVLRMYDVIGFMTMSKESPVGGVTLSEYYIPAGTIMTTYGAVMSRMPEYYDSPDTFNPSRFNPENQRPSQFVYFPFGVGHRSCIARHFAMMEMKITLARLYQSFQVILPPNYELQVDDTYTRRPVGDIPCTLIPWKMNQN